MKKSKSKRFRSLLKSQKTEFLMEAHNGLSARIVERAGFRCIWASGLSISTALGVRDANEASWTQVLDVVEFMSDATSIPIMVDVDTGYGDYNNVRRLTRKLEQRDVSAMCMEDKLYPKKNSLLKGAVQPLADIGEFCGKIRAAKDTQRDPDFCVVARTEAFVARRGLEEAIERAEAYAEAGADAVVVHDNTRSPDNILDFLGRWEQSCPVVIIPTTYYTTPVSLFEAAGVRLVIWANHMMRACLAAMERTAAEVFENKSLLSVEEKISAVDDVFRLFNYAELDLAEQKYLPRQTGVEKAVTFQPRVKVLSGGKRH